MWFRIAGRDVHLPKLIGSFVLFAALLMFFQAGAVMFDSWDNLKDIQNCLDAVQTNSTTIDVCQRSAYYAFDDMYIRANQTELTSRQVGAALLKPIAWLFFWAVVFILGIMFYRSGTIVIPIEESIKEIPDRWPKRKPGASSSAPLRAGSSSMEPRVVIPDHAKKKAPK